MNYATVYHPQLYAVSFTGARDILPGKTMDTASGVENAGSIIAVHKYGPRSRIHVHVSKKPSRKRKFFGEAPIDFGTAFSLS